MVSRLPLRVWDATEETDTRGRFRSAGRAQADGAEGEEGAAGRWDSGKVKVGSGQAGSRSKEDLGGPGDRARRVPGQSVQMDVVFPSG